MLTSRLYEFLADDEERVCKAISEEACKEVPGNFLRIFFANALTQVGDRILSPKTTLVWLLNTLGAPGFFAGLLVPLRESGSLLPQLFIAAAVRGRPIRKTIWFLGNLLQALSIVGMALVPLFLTGTTAGWAITGGITCFSLSRGLSSIASKDVLGKTIPKTRRGRLNGWVSSVGGILAALAGLCLIIPSSWSELNQTKFTWILAIGALLWMLSSWFIFRITEFPGATSGGGDAWPRMLGKLALLKTDRDFRLFVTIRAFAMGSGLSAPFVVSLAHRDLEGSSFWLGIFMLVDGLAAMLSGPFWGKLADRSSRRILMSAMAITAVLLGIVSIIGYLDSTRALAWLLYPLIFFLLGIAHSGIRLGRKTYLVDLAEGDKRTDYVAISNSLIGALLLVAGLITSLIALLSISGALLAFAAAALLGSLLALKLPEVSE